MSSWLTKNRSAIEAVLAPGERLLEAAGAIATRPRRRRAVPRRGFVLVVTDRRLLALDASAWRVRPGAVRTSWEFAEGVTLAPAAFGRARLVLPDRSVVTLAPFGGWSLRRLTAYTTAATSAK